MTDQAVETPIASGERTDQTVSVVVDEKPTLPENEHVTESLFGETVSDAELRGEEGTPTPPPAGEEKPVAPPPADAKPTETPPPASEEPKQPPPGFVPLAALHEERGKRQAQNQRIAELEAENTALKSGKPASETQPPVSDPAQPQKESQLPDDFKVLSKQEYRELAEQDVVEAQIYLHNLSIYKEEQAAAKAVSERQARANEQISNIVAQRYTEMEAAVPGLFADDGVVNANLTEFAMSQGVDEDVLSILTKPETRVRLEDGRTVILGKGATQFVKLLNSFYQSTKPDPSRTEALKAEGAAEVLNKIKDNSGGFRGIGDTPPGGSSIPADLSKPLSETEFAKLSEADQQRYLSGT